MFAFLVAMTTHRVYLTTAYFCLAVFLLATYIVQKDTDEDCFT